MGARTTSLPLANPTAAGSIYYWMLRHKRDQTGLGADVRLVLAACPTCHTARSIRHAVEVSGYIKRKADVLAALKCIEGLYKQSIAYKPTPQNDWQKLPGGGHIRRRHVLHDSREM